MSSAALKRVGNIAATHEKNMTRRGSVMYANDGGDLDVRDLRAVLALAKRAAGLKRRIRLARAAARGQMVSTSLWELLDLRKPLPKSRRRWNVEIAAAMKLEAELRRTR